MSPAYFDSLTTGSLDLGVAEVIEPAVGTLRVLAKANPARYALALLCLAVAAFTAWHAALDYTTRGLGGLWPGIAIVPVFATLALALCFFEQEKRFDAGARKATVSSRLLGHARRHEIALPLQGSIRLSASFDLARHDADGMRRIYTYEIDVAGHPALRFILRGDRESASAFTARLAQLLNYVVAEELEPEASGWHAVSMSDHGG